MHKHYADCGRLGWPGKVRKVSAERRGGEGGEERMESGVHNRAQGEVWWSSPRSRLHMVGRARGVMTGPDVMMR